MLGPPPLGNLAFRPLWGHIALLGHTRPKGYQQDCEKYNAAVLRGWRVLRYTRRDLERRPKQVVDEVAQALQRLLGETRGNHGDTESTED